MMFEMCFNREDIDPVKKLKGEEAKHSLGHSSLF